MKSPRLPLRLRLMLWYSLVFALAIFSIGYTCLWMVHRAIVELEDNELQQRVRSVRRFLDARPTQEPTDELRAAITAAYSVSHGSKWLQVVDEHGQWIYRSAHVAEAYPTLDLPQKLGNGSRYFDYVTGAPGAPLYVRALIATTESHGVRYTVQTGLTLNKTLAILSNFQQQLWLLTGLGLVMSSLAGYFMSRKALTPIAAIAAEAQRINDQSLNVRLPALESRDELAALSITLNQMLDRIEAGYQSVRSFTANAAHELRTPVALMRAETDVALAFPRDAEYYRETCLKLQQDSIQMSRIIDQLLTLTRADAGVEHLRLEPMNLSGLLEEITVAWAEVFAVESIQFRSETPNADLWIQGDYVALKRLFNTLLDNAWRYTPSGHMVSLECFASKGEVVVSIRDTGIGIAPEHLSRVFQRFYRAAQPLHGGVASSGLGLALGQWVATCHGSGLTVESSHGTGSCFTLALKVIPEPAHADDHSSTMVPGADISAHKGLLTY